MNDTDKLALEKGFSKNNSRSPIAAAAFAPKGRREDWRCRVRRTEASQYLLEVHGVATAPATLAKLAVVGGGPEYELWGRLPYYPTRASIAGPKHGCHEGGLRQIAVAARITKLLMRSPNKAPQVRRPA